MLQKYKLFNATDKGSNTPLHIAVEMGNTKCVKFLINQDEIVNREAKNKERRTPMHIAAIKGHEK